MMTTVNNNDVNVTTQVLSEVTTENNQLAFDMFCEFCKENYSLNIRVKPQKIEDKASFFITAVKENKESEEICLFLNQDILDLVMNYLESGMLGDISKINPNDLDSFNERGVVFKSELLQAERGKGKNVVFSYTIFSKLISIYYNHGVIIFHPYPTRIINPVQQSNKKEGKRTYPIVPWWILEDSTEEERVNEPDSDINCSLQLSPCSDTFTTAKKEKSLLANNLLNNNNMKKKNSTSQKENLNEEKTSSINPQNEERMNRYLKESKGNMYEFITNTFNPIIGECEHKCKYCYVSAMVKKQKPIRLEEKALKGSLGSNKFIFIGSGTDVFANSVKSEWITQTLDYCNQFNNKYLFQTKNTERLMEFIEHPVFKKSVICTTIESNRPYSDCKAPSAEDRVMAMEIIKLAHKIDTYVTIEPIMDFDLAEMVSLIKRCEPSQVNIGADSKRSGLIEPSAEKITELINQLSTFTTVKEKSNLKRLMINPMEKELKLAKKQPATSNTMKIQIMQKVKNGFTIKEENHKFGLLKENRPIKKSDVEGFLQIIQNGKYDESQSIVTVEATELIDNCNITDLEGNPISKEYAADYLIVLDGQHRISAFSQLNSIRKEENKITVPNVYIKTGLNSIREYLANINLVGHSWSTADKICVSAVATKNKILAKVNELVKDGFNASTAVLICAGGKRIEGKDLKILLSSGDESCLKNNDYTDDELLEFAERFLITVRAIEGMTTKIMTKRFYIKGFTSFAKSISYDAAFAALEKLTLEDFKGAREDDLFLEKLSKAYRQAA